MISTIPNQVFVNSCCLSIFYNITKLCLSLCFARQFRCRNSRKVFLTLNLTETGKTPARISVKVRLKAEVFKLYSLINNPSANFKSKTYSPIFFIFTHFQMPIVVGKSVNFLLTKFTSKSRSNSGLNLGLLPVEKRTPSLR